MADETPEWVIAKDATCGNCHSPRASLSRSSATTAIPNRWFVNCVECAWTGLAEFRRADDPRELAAEVEAVQVAAVPEASKAPESADDAAAVLAEALEEAPLTTAIADAVVRRLLAMGIGATPSDSRIAEFFESRELFSMELKGYQVAGLVRTIGRTLGAKP